MDQLNEIEKELSNRLELDLFLNAVNPSDYENGCIDSLKFALRIIRKYKIGENENE